MALEVTRTSIGEEGPLLTTVFCNSMATVSPMSTSRWRSDRPKSSDLEVGHGHHQGVLTRTVVVRIVVVTNLILDDRRIRYGDRTASVVNEVRSDHHSEMNRELIPRPDRLRPAGDGALPVLTVVVRGLKDHP